ncbi:hypothetical protein BASA83_008760 [Batrachochytrium salamandrivorans]|nr:hypothetical protein BASA83_008760 [Batrachochytrium salamandrivorans]
MKAEIDGRVLAPDFASHFGLGLMLVTGFSPFYLMFGIHPRLPPKQCGSGVALDENTPDYFFKVGDMVKMKHHDRLKLEFKWKGPYHVVDVGHPGTYWIMTPQGLRLPNAVNQNDLAPWLSPVVDNVDFFYDGTSRNSGSF